MGATVGTACGGPYSDGPLTGFDDTGQQAYSDNDGQDLEVGQEMTLGWQVLTNETEEPITVTDVSLVMGSLAWR